MKGLFIVLCYGVIVTQVTGYLQQKEAIVTEGISRNTSSRDDLHKGVIILTLPPP